MVGLPTEVASREPVGKRANPPVARPGDSGKEYHHGNFCRA